MKSIAFKFTQVTLTKIDPEDCLTEFSLLPGGADCSRRAALSGSGSNISRPGTLSPLKDSIEEIGVIHPVTLMKSADRYQIICGHRRVKYCKMLGLSEIPARVTDTNLDPQTRLTLNLMENRSHRSYSDIEKGRIIDKLVRAGVSGEMIIRKYMPIMGLERSKKLYLEFSRVQGLETGLQNLLHELNVPLRIFSPLLEWSDPCRESAQNLFSTIRPGINKWRELLELAEEIARIENKLPGDILGREDIQSLLFQSDLQTHEKYDQIVKALTPWRYPMLNDLRKKIAGELDQLPLGPRTKIRIQESFESEEIKIEIKSRDQKSLVHEVEQLASAARSVAMGELLRILKELR
jgi:ParB/Sulfiredoxin domain